jgi:C4-dicarboxylate-specific signal transduction histidine kinase
MCPGGRRLLNQKRIGRVAARLGFAVAAAVSIAATPGIGADAGFDRPNLWDHYRGEIITVAAVVVLQSLLISILLFERRRRSLAEAESHRRLLEVAHLNRAATVSAMSASITHEINQPLGAILSNADAAEELLKSDRLDRVELAAILADIRRDDQRAAEIIRSMRGLLRRSEIVSREFDLNDTIRDALGIIGPEARSRRVTLTADLESGALLVRADPVHLQQVVLNLAINGMDAMQNGAPDGRMMEIRAARASNSEVIVTVSDAGTGIPEDELKSIFEPFYTTKAQGTGLGLSIAHTIVTTYGGKIWAENRESGGAVFRFTLPLAGGLTSTFGSPNVGTGQPTNLLK